MEVDKCEKSSRREEPHLSGAYIRSLVKQLTSSRSKEPLSTRTDPEGGVDENGFSGQNPTKIGQPQQGAAPQQHKKQVRRRLHTSRPYQERLLNMAEARREIVTALKFHRATMKQQANEQQQQQLSLQSPPAQPLQQDEQEMMNSRRYSRAIYPSSSTANFSNYLDNISYSSLSSYSSPNPYSWATSSIAPPSVAENFNLALPNQALGLNLNIHDFNNLDATLYHNNNSYPSFSPSSSSSPTLSSATTEDLIPNLVTVSQEGTSVVDMTGGGGLHPAMDDEEMAEIRSIGEQHDMEWSDKMNLVTSAWWFKFLKTMEIGPEAMSAEDDGYNSPFDQVMEFPSWLINANEGCLQQHFNDLSSDDYFQDPALPW